jgi:hypothetical protein
MELTGLTPDALEERLRLEAGVDALAGRPVATRVVAFDGPRPVLLARARPRHEGEDGFEPLFELLYLISNVRPRGFVLGLPVRLLPWEHREDGSFELLVLQVERSLGRVRHGCVTHPFHVSELGMLGWGPARTGPTPAGLRVLAHAATRRRPRARRRPPERIAQLLTAAGHLVELSPSASSRSGAAAET